MRMAFVFQEQPPFGEKYLHENVSVVKILALPRLEVKHIQITITAFVGEFFTRGALREFDQRSSQVDFLPSLHRY